MGACVYDCRHPLWGGSGVCRLEACVCGSGYTQFDALSASSCVSTAALRMIYSLVLAVGSAMTVFMMWHVAKDKHLSAMAQCSRRAILRRRVMIPTSIYVVGTTLVVILALTRESFGLFGALPFFIWYGIALPAGNFACMLGAEVWVEALPLQLLPADSMPTKLKVLAEQRSVFVWMASLLMGSMMVIATSAPFFGIRSTSRVINLMSIFTCSTACVCIIFVGISITRVIYRMDAKVSDASRAMYAKALRTLWFQVCVLCGMGAIWVIFTSALELTPVAHKTPSIPLAIMFVDGCVMLSSIVHFSKVPEILGSNLGGKRASLFGMVFDKTVDGIFLRKKEPRKSTESLADTRRNTTLTTAKYKCGGETKEAHRDSQVVPV